MSRCVACDRIMRSSEIIWYEDQKRFESHCRKCKNVEGVRDTLLKMQYEMEKVQDVPVPDSDEESVSSDEVPSVQE